ncbi:MAG: FAD-dependent oxidoreductase [Spirochaetota bacterium]
MERYEIVVAGGGPAAITLAKQLGKQKQMAVIRPEDHSMIYCAMPYVIEGLLDMEKTLKKDALVTGSGAHLIRDRVSSVDTNDKSLTLASGSCIGYDKLVLATGAEPLIPPVPGSHLTGVMGFKTEKHLKRLLERIGNNVTQAVVVGAGAIGIELAQALTDAGVSVDLVDMAETVLPNLVDGEMTGELAQELKEKGIKLHLGAKVVELKGSHHVEQVHLDNGTALHIGSSQEAGLVIFAAGMTPSVDLVRDTDIELGPDGIVINARMETNVPDVYAVGDCTQFISGITGTKASGKLATNAVPMAKVLAAQLRGEDRRYPGFYNGAATKVGRFYVGATGLSQAAAEQAGFSTVAGYSEVTTQFPIMPEAKQLKVKLIAEKPSGRLLGAQVISGEPVTGRIDLLTFAVQKQATLEELRDLSYSSQPYQSFFPAANGVVLASEDAYRQLS